MARPKEWERIARDLHFSLQSFLDSVADKTEEMVIATGNEVYVKNSGLLLKEILWLDRQVAKARNLSVELQALIEDNGKTFAEIEKEIAGRNYRTKEGR